MYTLNNFCRFFFSLVSCPIPMESWTRIINFYYLIFYWYSYKHIFVIAQSYISNILVIFGCLNFIAIVIPRLKIILVQEDIELSWKYMSCPSGNSVQSYELWLMTVSLERFDWSDLHLLWWFVWVSSLASAVYPNHRYLEHRMHFCWGADG